MALRRRNGEEALALARRILVIREALQQLTHAERLEALGGVGRALVAAGQPAAGIVLLRTTLAKALAAQTDRQLIEWLRFRLGYALVDEGHAAEAAALLDQTAVYYLERQGRIAWDLGTLQLASSRAHAKLGHRAKALELAQRARARYVASGDLVPEDVAKAEAWLKRLKK